MEAQTPARKLTGLAGWKQRLAALGIAPKEVIEEFTRAPGPGGQLVNKVETAVRLRHPSTGLTAVANDFRSREANRCLAWERLAHAAEERARQARLQRLAEAARERRRRALRSEASKKKLIEAKRRRAARLAQRRISGREAAGHWD